MQETLRTLAVCLALGLLQMLALCTWLWRVGAQAPSWLRLGSVLVMALTALLCALCFKHMRRLLLWRRRRSPRPSREVQAERRRIAADLHDGVGGLLVNAMALLEPGDDRQRQAHELLEQALLDLRLTVDSMDAVDDALPVRLARLRHRLQPVLDRRGMQMSWNVADPHADTPLRALPALPRGQPSQQLVAIAQEAVSNALQHAQASTLWVVLEPLEQGRQVGGDTGSACWELRVEDDGRGFPCNFPTAPSEEAQTLQSRGLGLAGMQRRAHAMGATLAVVPRDGGGTVVRVRW